MSNLVEHAMRELDRLNVYDSEDREMYDSILKAVEAFAEYKGHSGGSAAWAIGILNRLLNFENLTPLTGDPDEWIEVGPSVWQNNRNSKAFSEDGGSTYYSLDDPEERLYSTHRED